MGTENPGLLELMFHRDRLQTQCKQFQVAGRWSGAALWAGRCPGGWDQALRSGEEKGWLWKGLGGGARFRQRGDREGRPEWEEQAGCAGERMNASQTCPGEAQRCGLSRRGR